MEYMNDIPDSKKEKYAGCHNPLDVYYEMKQEDDNVE
jgi:hypothetical protein